MKYLILFASFLFILSGCGLGDANEAAQKRSDEFHKQMKAQNTDAMLTFVHEGGLEANDKEEWRALFEEIHTIGNIKSIKKDKGFNSSVNNGIHTVTLNYTIEAENSKLKETIVWQTSKDKKLKIIRYDIKAI